MLAIAPSPYSEKEKAVGQMTLGDALEAGALVVADDPILDLIQIGRDQGEALHASADKDLVQC
jgi:hypothetical protein